MADNGSSSLMEKLKAATGQTHTRLESLPYFRALIEHKLPLSCYVNQLRALAIIHGVLEHELATCPEENVVSVWRDDLRKLPLLEQDLLYFNPRFLPESNPATTTALAMAEKIRLRKIQRPQTLLGYLYVFEGSTLGNHMHLPDIMSAYDLQGAQGCRYYASYAELLKTRWQQFCAAMNGIPDQEKLHELIVAAAHEAFANLETLYTELFLQKPKASHHVTQINPEAGNHPIPEDQQEIYAALKASDRGWNQFGYYQARYSERGKRFSDSDSCWLVTLIAFHQQAINTQVEWLCRLLATRGMPSLMLEQTLTFLYEELVAAQPEKVRQYQKLQKASEHLGKRRRAVLNDETLSSLATDFEKGLEPELLKRYHNLGRLILCSVIDEHNGMAGATHALTDWLAGKGNFPRHSLEQVEHFIEKTKKLLR